MGFFVLFFLYLLFLGQTLEGQVEDSLGTICILGLNFRWIAQASLSLAPLWQMPLRFSRGT